MEKKRFIEPKSHIILALDTEDIQQGYDVMDQCYDLVDCIKLNYPLVLKEGLKIVGKLKDKYKLPIFCDFKVADVPVTNNRIIKIVADAGGDAIMIHGIVGPDGLEEALDAADNKISLVVQTEFTHPGGLMFTQGIANSLVELALEYGCQAVQAPGNRIESIREVKNIVKDKCKIVCCGVGAQGGKYGDVLAAGGDFPIIGRAIYKAEKPREYIIKNILKNRSDIIC